MDCEIDAAVEVQVGGELRGVGEQVERRLQVAAVERGQVRVDTPPGVVVAARDAAVGRQLGGAFAAQAVGGLGQALVLQVFDDQRVEARRDARRARIGRHR